MTLSAEWIAGLRNRTESELTLRAPDILQRFPVDRYIAGFDSLPVPGPYHRVPDDARRAGAAIAECAGEDGLEAYLRLAMLRLVERKTARPDSRLTPEVAALRDSHFARIVSAMETPRKRFYRHGNDLFAKDFALCRGKLVPCGAELADLHSGISRRVLITGGARQFMTGLGFLASRAGGVRPFCEIHFDRRAVGEFHAEGYARLYLRLAGLLIRNPAIRGVISGSWWHDPALARISPELGFIDRDARNGGAKLFRIGPHPDATAGATRFAPARAELHKRGEYQPENWLLVWARRDLLAWAERQ